MGAVTGEDRNVNACLDCGTSWKAADLYNILQVIKKTTNETLNLEFQKDREYMNDFMSEVIPYFKALSDTEKEAEKIVTDVEKKLSEHAAMGCTYGCLTSFFGCSAVTGIASGNEVLFLTLIIPPLIGFSIGWLHDQSIKVNLEKEINATKRKAERIKYEANYQLQQKILEFQQKHNL